MKALVVFDPDGTLAESKSAIDAEMAMLLTELLGVVKVAIISGGDFPQFEKQVLAHFPQNSHLDNLSLLPKPSPYSNCWRGCSTSSPANRQCGYLWQLTVSLRTCDKAEQLRGSRWSRAGTQPSERFRWCPQWRTMRSKARSPGKEETQHRRQFWSARGITIGEDPLVAMALTLDVAWNKERSLLATLRRQLGKKTRHAWRRGAGKLAVARKLPRAGAQLLHPRRVVACPSDL